MKSRKLRAMSIFSKQIKRVFGIVPGLLLAFSVVSTSEVGAASWEEAPDAGDLISSAQVPIGVGTLNQITGVISNSHDVDLYKIFINDIAAFSASTIAGDPEKTDTDELDAALALFDAAGRGVYYNDDGEFDNANAILPAGDANSPNAPGVHYLAMFDDDGVALSGSATSIDDLIFPLVLSPYTDVVGPTETGGSFPLSSWGFDPDTAIDFDNNIGLDGEYIINLTGAQFVPLPPAIWLLGTCLIGLLGIAKKRKAA